MPVYEYLALDTKGRTQKGIVDAVSITAARQKLRETQFFPVEVRESLTGEKKAISVKETFSDLFGKIGLRDISIMTRQLSTLLGAGIPLVSALNALVKQTIHPQLRKTLAQIKEKVNEGSSLTESMSCFPQVFSSFYISMVRAGEASGAVNLVLERLADFNENKHILQTKIRSALAYPILMFLIGSIVLMFMLTFVIPNITKVFGEMHQTLPVITVFLILVSKFLQSFWWLLGVMIIATIIGVRYTVTRTSRGRYTWDRIKLKLPFFASVNQKMAIARFSRTLGTLLQSGVPLLTALEIVKSVVNNRIIADAIQNAGKAVEEGQNLSSPLLSSGLFPPIAIEMISVGEQSGNLETMLYKIADAYEKEVESSILMLTSLLEPAMILFMGLIVGFIVISILLPIFEMNQLIR